MYMVDNKQTQNTAVNVFSKAKATFATHVSNFNSIVFCEISYKRHL